MAVERKLGAEDETRLTFHIAFLLITTPEHIGHWTTEGEDISTSLRPSDGCEPARSTHDKQARLEFTW